MTTGKDDQDAPDLHCVAYDAAMGRVTDNAPITKVLQKKDRTQANAHKVFDSLFADLEVRIKNIYELL